MGAFFYVFLMYIKIMFEKESHNDVVIVGSGLAGLHAAYPLVLSGKNVVMLDVGFDESRSLEDGPNVDFPNYRKFEPCQHKVFLGDDLSGIGAYGDDRGHAASMTSGRRKYIARQAEDYLPVKSKDVIITQSLAAGGLSEAWGAVCGFFDEKECDKIGIPYEELRKHYETIIERVGVSGRGTRFSMQPPAIVDDNSMAILEKYNKKKDFFKRRGFLMEQPPLALLTKDFDSRRKTTYRDMDFWDNKGRSVYRGHYTLEKLKAYRNFSYMKDSLVTSVKQDVSGAIVTAKNIQEDTIFHVSGKVVIMAAGAINTTRILLKSFNLFDQKVPIILKNNYLIPSLLLSRLGKVASTHRHSLCQLVLSGMGKNTSIGNVYGQFYSYNSLLLFKLLRFIPLPTPEALATLALIVPALILVDIRFSTGTSPTGFSILRRDARGNDYLKIEYTETKEREEQKKKKIGEIKRALVSLGLFPLKVVRSAFGSASHYAGGIPFSDSPPESGLGVNRYGQLYGAERIYVADTASWNALPAKPPGLTIMANANRIGSYVRDQL